MKSQAKDIYWIWGVAILAFGVCGCSAGNPRILAEINQGASLSGALPANPLAWRVISFQVDTKNATMSTLYGNDLAVEHARSAVQHNYPGGAVLSVVTWSQQEDDRWFGAKIAAQVKSVEFVFVESPEGGAISYSYAKYEGSPLQKGAERRESVPSGRTAEILSARAAVLP